MCSWSATISKLRPDFDLSPAIAAKNWSAALALISLSRGTVTSKSTSSAPPLRVAGAPGSFCRCRLHHSPNQRSSAVSGSFWEALASCGDREGADRSGSGPLGEGIEGRGSSGGGTGRETGGTGGRGGKGGGGGGGAGAGSSVPLTASAAGIFSGTGSSGICPERGSDSTGLFCHKRTEGSLLRSRSS